MTVHASAPGKLVLIGEYAVLDGAPALVLALDRRAAATLAPRAAAGCVIDAPELGLRDVGVALDAAGRLRLAGGALAAETPLAFAAACIEDVAARRELPAFHATLDTRAFFSAADGHAKFGLGSSAALTTALAGALHAWAGLPPPRLDGLIAVHRRVQGGRGSGLDVATSLTGGLIAFRRDADGAHVERVAWPVGVFFSCAWSMRPASTGVFLRSLAAWRADAPERCATHFRELARIAAAAAAALAAEDAGALLETIDAYAAGLARLGAASGLDIVSAEHRALAAIAARCGVAYKPCGAGGGDVGVALARDPRRLAAFRQGVAQAGLQTLAVALDRRGLDVDETC